MYVYAGVCVSWVSFGRTQQTFPHFPQGIALLCRATFKLESHESPDNSNSARTQARCFQELPPTPEFLSYQCAFRKILCCWKDTTSWWSRVSLTSALKVAVGLRTSPSGRNGIFWWFPRPCLNHSCQNRNEKYAKDGWNLVCAWCLRWDLNVHHL